MYAQCPTCRTTFRIGATQLALAQGLVRCGECRQLFNALEHLRDELPEEETGAVPAVDERADQAPPAESYPGETAGFVESEPEPAAPEAQEEEAVDTWQFVESPEVADTGHEADYAAEDEAEYEATSEERREPTFSESTIEDESWTEIMAAPVDEAHERTEDAFDVEAPAAQTATAEAFDAPVSAAHAEPAPIPAAKAARAEAARGHGGVFWSLVILTLLAVLVIQYAYFMREDLAQYSILRPWLVKFCDMAGCSLPMKRDLTRIELVERNVVSHPTAKNALLISATMVNRADFPQPYPLLEIRLSDVNGQPVALRRFTPQEYLAENVQPDSGMLPELPVHLTLEVEDPSTKATAFQFEFR